MTTKIKEEYLYDDFSEQINDSDKCGEVFVTKTGVLTYFCIVCKQTYEDTEIFSEHILSLHLGLIQPKTENIPYLENSILVSLDISTNILENEMKESKSKGTRKITLNKNVITDPLHQYKLQTEQDEDKNPSEADSNVEEYEMSEFTGMINNCKSPDRIDGSDSNKDDNLDLRPYKCNICKTTYKMKSAFLLHKKQHEKLMPNCQHCGKYFRKISAFKTHNQILCSQRIKPGHKIKLELPDIKCKYCEIIFKNKGALKKHEERHEDSQFECNVCQKKFMVKQKLVTHIRTHTGEKPYKCEYCSVSFGNATNFKRHVLIHIGEKAFLCTFGCDKSFYTERDRAGHERIHTGEKPFVCELCGRYFAFQHQLSLHKRRSHMDKKNWPNKCDQCNKVFLIPKQLQEHNVVHTGEKPFECDQCPGRFSKSSGLREHKKLHSGIKKHVCTICNKAFAQTAGLYSHMKSHGIIKGIIEMS